MGLEEGKDKLVVSKKKVYIAVIIIFAIVISGIMIIVLGQQNSGAPLIDEEKLAVEGISVNLSNMEYYHYISDARMEIELEIQNDASLDVSLEDATITLFVNGLNIDTKGFETKVILLNAQDYRRYTANMYPDDLTNRVFRSFCDVSHFSPFFCTDREYRAVLVLSANAKCGDYASAINVEQKTTWN